MMGKEVVARRGAFLDVFPVRFAVRPQAASLEESKGFLAAGTVSSSLVPLTAAQCPATTTTQAPLHQMIAAPSTTPRTVSKTTSSAIDIAITTGKGTRGPLSAQAACTAVQSPWTPSSCQTRPAPTRLPNNSWTQSKTQSFSSTDSQLTTLKWTFEGCEAECLARSLIPLLRHFLKRSPAKNVIVS